MNEMVSEFSLTPDLMRLLIIPAFIYAAYLDYRTRRVYNEFWMPLIGLCFIVLGWDIAVLLMGPEAGQEEYLFSLSMSVLVAPSIAYTLWQYDIFGGADLKAIAFLAVFFPTFPEIAVNGNAYPIVEGRTPIFALTVLVNALIIAFAYRIALLLRNLVNTDISRFMTRATRYSTDCLHKKHGDIIEFRKGIQMNGVDIDTVRMYLQWRGISFHELRSNASFYRSTGPVIENEIGDGAPTDTASTPLGRSRAEFRQPSVDSGPSIVPLGAIQEQPSDAWGAEQFTKALEQKPEPSPPTPGELREALDTITVKEMVWVSPAIPFFVPLTIGLIVAVTYGSLFIGITEWIAAVIIETLVE